MRLGRINRTLLNDLNAPHLSSIDSNKHEVLPHPPNYLLRPLGLVLPGANQSFFLCHILRSNRRVPDRMQYVCLLHLHYAASLSYSNPPHRRTNMTSTSCFCTNAQFVTLAAECVLANCSDTDAQAAENYWEAVCLPQA